MLFSFFLHHVDQADLSLLPLQVIYWADRHTLHRDISKYFYNTSTMLATCFPLK